MREGNFRLEALGLKPWRNTSKKKNAKDNNGGVKWGGLRVLATYKKYDYSKQQYFSYPVWRWSPRIVIGFCFLIVPALVFGTAYYVIDTTMERDQKHALEVSRQTVYDNNQSIKCNAYLDNSGSNRVWTPCTVTTKADETHCSVEYKDGDSVKKETFSVLDMKKE